MTESVGAIDVGQTDYMKLFMQELTYQDPLKPVDNREFMAQMAQFSALQQAVSTNQNVENLLEASYANRAINLIGKSVKIAGSDENAIVKTVNFNDNKLAEILIQTDKNGSFKVNLQDITEVY